MKTVVFLLALLILLTTVVEAQVYVPGYQRRDHTWVRPHKRTYPDATIKANYNRAATFALGHSR